MFRMFQSSKLKKQIVKLTEDRDKLTKDLATARDEFYQAVLMFQEEKMININYSIKEVERMMINAENIQNEEEKEKFLVMSNKCLDDLNKSLTETKSLYDSVKRLIRNKPS